MSSSRVPGALVPTLAPAAVGAVVPFGDGGGGRWNMDASPAPVAPAA